MANPDGDREEGAMLDAGSDDEDGHGVPPPGQPRRDRLERIALFDFLRLVAGNRELQPGFRTVEELVHHLKTNDTITSDAVSRAMLACPRDLFVPPAHRHEALADRPIRVEAAGFNISAPHVQAVALQALELQPGHRVLDVGCGCGVVTAYAAYLTGSSGVVVGIDIRDSALSLASSNLQRLRAHSVEFSELAAPIKLERHNVFVPLRRHVGRYDAVHIGGAMPYSRLGAVLDLLGPKGGRIVAPVSSELRLIIKSPEGTVRHQMLSQVSFSELELPRDLEVVTALHEEQAEEARRVDVPPSTFAADLVHLAAPGVDLKAVVAAAAAAGSAAAGSVAAGSVAGETAVARSTNGVRPRSDTSLADDHVAAATPPPAHRHSGREGKLAAAAAGAAAGAEASHSHAAGGGVTAGGGGGGGWGWRWETPPAALPSRGGGTKGGGGGAVAAEEEEEQSLLGTSGCTAEMEAAAAAAPAGPLEAEEPLTETAAAGGSGSRAGGGGEGNGGGGLSYLDGVYDILALGPPDCELAGDGWRLPAHKAVLQARCELLRAHMSSGMRDSDAATYQVPEAVERRMAVEAFLHFVYKDILPADVPTELVPQLLHAGIYFGCHRLVRLCEALLAAELVAASSRSRAGEAEGNGDGDGDDDGEGDPDGMLAAAVAAAGPLLALADEGGLDGLRRVAMQFVLDHFPAVSASDGYRQLPRTLVDQVAAEAVRQSRELLSQLKKLGGGRGPQSPGRGDEVMNDW